MMEKGQTIQSKNDSQYQGTQFNFLIMPNTISQINTTLFSINTIVNQFVTQSALLHYRYMMAGHRKCQMSITVFEPMSKSRADDLNTTRNKIAYSLGSGAAGIAGPAGLVVGATVGLAVRSIVLSDMRTYHKGDLVVGIDALVSGGIGPQRSTKSYVIPRDRYDKLSPT